MRDRKKLLSIILVFAMVLQMAFPTYADTRTVRRTLTKTTTTYTTQKIKLKKNACFLLQEKRCACQPMSLIWKTY